MSTPELKAILHQLHSKTSDLYLSMIIAPDGLLVCHEGNVEDPELCGAYFLELKIVAEKIINELHFGDIEEIFIRSKSGCVTILPIFEKGYLACMSSPNLNSGKLQMLGWSAISKLYTLL